MIRTYKYRLYPNKTSQKQLFALLTCQRHIYNQALEHRINTYKKTSKNVFYVDQWNKFKDIRKSQYPLVNATSMQQLLRRLDKSFKDFFRRIKTKDKPGFPRFKNQDRFKSIEFTYGDGCKLQDKTHKLYVQNAGTIRIKWHRDFPKNSKLKHVVIKYSANKWFVNFMLDIPNTIIKNNIVNNPVGIDVGISHLATLNNGTFFDSPKYLIATLGKLRILQRKLSRCKRGSNGRQKAKLFVSKLYEKITNQRHDFLHKITSKITQEYSNIFLEDMNLNFIMKNKHLAKHASDVAIGEFRQMLRYKAEEAGNEVILINPKNTSQLCSRCGHIVPKELKDRVHKCLHCGYIADRDINAAQNILLRGLGTSLEPLTYRNTESVGSEAVYSN